MIKNCNFFTDTAISTLDVKPLITLDLTGCQQITNKTLIFLSKNAKNLETLNLGGIKNLIDVGQTNFFGNITIQPLEFLNLKVLNVGDCSNLMRLYIKAPKLHYLNVTNCALLTDPMLDNVIEHSKG